MITANGSARPIDYATEYHGAGLSVIPIRGDATKGPAVSGWKQYQDQPASLEELRRWFLCDNVGVAIIGGQVSGNLEIIDIDEGELFDDFCELLRETTPGLITQLTAVETPRPGVHLYYRCETIEGNQKLAFSEPRPQFDGDGQPVINPTTGEQLCKPETLIETRGAGGYVLAPGSPPDCHPLKRCYTHISGPPSD